MSYFITSLPNTGVLTELHNMPMNEGYRLIEKKE